MTLCSWLHSPCQASEGSHSAVLLQWQQPVLGGWNAHRQVGFTGHRTSHCHHPNSKVQAFHSTEYNKTCYLSSSLCFWMFSCFQHRALRLLQAYQSIFPPPFFLPCVLFPVSGLLGLRDVTWNFFSDFKRIGHVVKFLPFTNTWWITPLHCSHWLHSHPWGHLLCVGCPELGHKAAWKQQINILIKQFVSIS